MLKAIFEISDVPSQCIYRCKPTISENKRIFFTIINMDQFTFVPYGFYLLTKLPVFKVDWIMQAQCAVHVRESYVLGDSERRSSWFHTSIAFKVVFCWFLLVHNVFFCQAYSFHLIFSTLHFAKPQASKATLFQAFIKFFLHVYFWWKLESISTTIFSFLSNLKTRDLSLFICFWNRLFVSHLFLLVYITFQHNIAMLVSSWLLQVVCFFD